MVTVAGIPRDFVGQLLGTCSVQGFRQIPHVSEGSVVIEHVDISPFDQKSILVWRGFGGVEVWRKVDMMVMRGWRL